MMEQVRNYANAMNHAYPRKERNFSFAAARRLCLLSRPFSIG